MTAALPPVPAAIYAPIEVNNECLAGAAAYYNIPPEAILAIRIQEAGRIGHYGVNTNGSKDLGPMQINSTHLRFFSAYGISKDQLVNDECTNLYAGAYIFYSELVAANGDVWRAIGNYHSHTPVYHKRYQKRVYGILMKLKTNYQPYLTWLRGRAQQIREKLLSDSAMAGADASPTDGVGSP